jgi:hypothetical protein
VLGDKAHSVIFDNSRARQLAPGWNATIPWSDGARQIVEWFDADPARRRVDATVDATMDAFVAGAG